MWEDELVEESIKRLTSVVLQMDVEDRWIWNLHSPSCYISSVNKTLFKVDDNNQANSQILWLKQCFKNQIEPDGSTSWTGNRRRIQLDQPFKIISGSKSE